MAELENQLESAVQVDESTSIDEVQWAEMLEDLKNNPIHINLASREELQKIPFLNVFQVHNLMQYRMRTGHIYSPQELIAVKGFDRETIQRLLPYLDFDVNQRPSGLRGSLKYSRHDLLLRSGRVLQKRQGFETQSGAYLGSPQRFYIRSRSSFGRNITTSLVHQKDEGEPFGGRYQSNGFDFTSANLSLKDLGKLKKLIIGDYHAQFGQGLALWTGMALNKSASTLDIKRYPRLLSPYSGSEENAFFRGVALSFNPFKPIAVSAFYSSRKLDANLIRTDSVAAEREVSSLQSTGLHRTLNELQDKDLNRLQTFGANLQWHHNNARIGATAFKHKLDIPIAGSSQAYRAFNLKGQHWSKFSVDANMMINSINAFGEFAMDQQSQHALLLGFQSSLGHDFYLSLLYRDFSKAYQALYSAPFGERGTYGERGLYAGLEWKFARAWRLNAYADQYSFSWLRFGVTTPSTGYDVLGQLEYSNGRDVSFYTRVRHEVSDLHNPTSGGQTVSRWRVHFVSSLGPNSSSSSRIEYSWAAGERGYLVFQELKVRLQRLPMRFSCRLALADTPGFNSRIYAYESDLSLSMSIPPYYGRSSRLYLLIQYKPHTKVGLELRYAQTTFYDRNSIGSGPQQISGNVISELKFQLRFKF